MREGCGGLWRSREGEGVSGKARGFEGGSERIAEGHGGPWRVRESQGMSESVRKGQEGLGRVKENYR